MVGWGGVVPAAPPTAGSVVLAESLGVAGVLAEARASTVVPAEALEALGVLAEARASMVVVAAEVLEALGVLAEARASTVVPAEALEALAEAPVVLVVAEAGAPTVTGMVEVTVSVAIVAST